MKLWSWGTAEPPDQGEAGEGGSSSLLFTVSPTGVGGRPGPQAFVGAQEPVPGEPPGIGGARASDLSTWSLVAPRRRNPSGEGTPGPVSAAWRATGVL